MTWLTPAKEMSDAELAVNRERSLENLARFEKEIAIRNALPVEPPPGSVVVFDYMPDVAWWNAGSYWTSYDRAELSWRSLLDNRSTSGHFSYRVIHRGKA